MCSRVDTAIPKLKIITVIITALTLPLCDSLSVLCVYSRCSVGRPFARSRNPSKRWAGAQFVAHTCTTTRAIATNTSAPQHRRALASSGTSACKRSSERYIAHISSAIQRQWPRIYGFMSFIWINRNDEMIIRRNGSERDERYDFMYS